MHVADDPPFIQDSGWAEVIRYSSQRCGRGLSCYADCAPGYDEGFGHGYTTDNGDTYKASQYAARSVLLSYLPIAPPRHYFLLITRHLRSIPPCHQCPHHASPCRKSFLPEAADKSSFWAYGCWYMSNVQTGIFVSVGRSLRVRNRTHAHQLLGIPVGRRGKKKAPLRCSRDMAIAWKRWGRLLLTRELSWPPIPVRRSWSCMPMPPLLPPSRCIIPRGTGRRMEHRLPSWRQALLHYGPPAGLHIHPVPTCSWWPLRAPLLLGRL